MAGNRQIRRIGAAAVFAACLAATVSGCSSVAEQSLGQSALVDPGKFTAYTCQDVLDRAEALRIRQRELEQLMSRSSQGAGGEFINAIAYRSEFTQNKAELNQISAAKEDKQCAVDSKFSSGRSVF